MIRRPPRSTLSSSSAASDVYKRQDIWFESNKFAMIASDFDLTILPLVVICLKFSAKKSFGTSFKSIHSRLALFFSRLNSVIGIFVYIHDKLFNISEGS